LWRLLQKLPLPETIDVQRMENLGQAKLLQCNDADESPGLSLSNGVARGRVHIVEQTGHTLTEGLIAQAGQILVCPALDPGFTPLVLRAAGLIVERGGVLSHGAIVARQMGIPAVVLPDAVSRLREGETVVVDGDRGLVLRQRGP
jgi:pyruvate,water dikinase